MRFNHICGNGKPFGRGELACGFWVSALTASARPRIGTARSAGPPAAFLFDKVETMKVRSSLKSLKGRHRDCKVVRRKGRVYVINKTDPRFKAKQG